MAARMSLWMADFRPDHGGRNPGDGAFFPDDGVAEPRRWSSDTPTPGIPIPNAGNPNPGGGGVIPAAGDAELQR